MAQVKKRRNGKRAVPTPQHQAWEDLLYGGRAAKIVAIAATVTAFLYLFGVFKPLLDSGPPPFPAREEVDRLREQTGMSFDSMRKNVDEATQAIKQITVKAAQDAAETRASRLSRLITQRVQLTALIEMNPNDQTIRGLLENTNAQIIQLQTEITREANQAASSQTLTPPTPRP